MTTFIEVIIMNIPFMILLSILYFYCVKYIDYIVPVKYPNDNELDKIDPFVVSFRKTRIESLLISKVEEIQKDRYVQFVVSCFYYHNEKSIKGCMYVITSKVLYKLFFIKNKLICKEVYRFNTFVYSYNKECFNKILDYLNDNKHYEKQRHHTEFFTWPHYYLVNDYEKQTKDIELFLSSC
jgi:hypothetical protein